MKIGGSLLRVQDRLKTFCRELPEVGKLVDLAIVPGGGVFADEVRRLYDTLGLSDSTAHFAAITAMDVYGLILSDLIPKSRPVTSLYEAKREIRQNVIPVILPSRIMMDVDVLEHSWEVTSDSISAYIASLLGARKLVLVKDVEGLYSSDPRIDRKATMIELIDASELERLSTSTCIDRTFPKLLIDYGLECMIIGPNIENLVKAVKGEGFRGTRILPR